MQLPLSETHAKIEVARFGENKTWLTGPDSLPDEVFTQCHWECQDFSSALP